MSHNSSIRGSFSFNPSHTGFLDPDLNYLSESSEEQLCRGTGPVQEDLRYQSDGHLQNTQQTDGQVEAGGTHLEQGSASETEQLIPAGGR